MSTPVTYKFQCKQCKFNISRTDKDLNNDCPKCLVKNPYIAPTQAAKIDDHKKLMSPNSKATRVSTAVCPSASNGEVHTYQLGSCKFCKKSEGSLEDKPRAVGATAYVGGKADCSSGGKHMFAFSKCTKCGMSELEYTKQKKTGPAATTTTAPSTPIRTPASRPPVGATATTPVRTVAPVSTTPTRTATATSAPASSVASPRTRPTATTTATTGTTVPRPTAATTTPSMQPAAPSTPRRVPGSAPAPTTPATTPVTKPATASSAAKTYKFQCKQCKFNISRTDKDLNNDCPKCLVKNPYVAPTQAAKIDDHKKLMSPNSKATRVSTAVCPSAPNGEVHTYQLGSCKFCKKSEGSLEDKPRAVGATAYVGGKADCSSGGKHMFAFSKCTKCGMSELEYTKQKKLATAPK